MICLKIKQTKEFMNKFLMTGAFSDFMLAEAVVTTFVNYTIDGRIRKDFYAKEELEERESCEFARWESLRPKVVQMIKGKHTPLLMKFVLIYAPEKTRLPAAGKEAAASGDMRKEAEWKPDSAHKIISGNSRNFVKDLLCAIKYENGMITLTSGISYQAFTMDKEPEKRWERELCRLLDRMELGYEII